MKKEAPESSSSWSLFFLPLCPSSFAPSSSQAVPAPAAVPRDRVRLMHSHALHWSECLHSEALSAFLAPCACASFPPCPHCSTCSGSHRPNPPSNPMPKPLPWMALRFLSRLHSACLGRGLSYGVFYRPLFIIWNASALPCRFLLASTRAFHPPLCAFSKRGAVYVFGRCRNGKETASIASMRSSRSMPW